MKSERRIRREEIRDWLKLLASNVLGNFSPSETETDESHEDYEDRNYHCVKCSGQIGDRARE